MNLFLQFTEMEIVIKTLGRLVYFNEPTLIR